MSLNTYLDITFSRNVATLEEALKLAKEVSFSLRDSYLPDTEDGFWQFHKVFSKEDFHFGTPMCEVMDTDGHDVFVYVTSRGKVRFVWSDVNCTVFIDVTSERECIAESTAFNDFTINGWSLTRLFIGERV